MDVSTCNTDRLRLWHLKIELCRSLFASELLNEPFTAQLNAKLLIQIRVSLCFPASLCYSLIARAIEGNELSVFLFILADDGALRMTEFHVVCLPHLL